jgi:hypothetical protein
LNWFGLPPYAEVSKSLVVQRQPNTDFMRFSQLPKLILETTGSKTIIHSRVLKGLSNMNLKGHILRCFQVLEFLPPAERALLIVEKFRRNSDSERK